MKKIYFVLTHSGSFLSNCVRLYTKKKYSHVSISLDENLEHMYSFGRLQAYNPFFGGFVQESPKYGTFKRFKNTSAKIYSLEISDNDYNKIKKIISKFDENKNDYRFNMIGLVAVILNKSIKRNKHFYCAEFVKYVLDNTDIDLTLPDIIQPGDFQKIDGSMCEYTGQLRDYKV